MLMGMRAKSIDRFKEQRDMDKKLGILADTSRGEKKVMQGYFEQKHHEHLEEKRLNKNTERGLNLHVNSAAKFRDGALNLTKHGINMIEGREQDRKGGIHKKAKKTYE
jgi:hypothetical protein